MGKRNVWFLIIVMGVMTFGFYACHKNSEDADSAMISTVFLVPLDGVSQSRINQLKTELEKNFFDDSENHFVVDILEHKNSSADCLNKAKTRLWARSMIDFLKTNYSDTAEAKAKENAVKYHGKYKDWYIIGVTNRDISTNFPGKDDYGIMGLSLVPNGKASIISTYRLRNKKDDLWKLAVHEFGHGYYNLPHCPEDIDTCLMQDAKHGNPHFELKTSFCETCSRSTRPGLINMIKNLIRN